MSKIVLAAALAIAAGPLAAQPDHSDHHGAGAKLAQAAPAKLAEGEVRRVDREAKKITIKHGPIASIDMPPMTMVFQVRDPAWLERVKVGDHVRFRAEKTDGAYLVTAIQPAP
jgi:Cu/Ag efflux protein CusF